MNTSCVLDSVTPDSGSTLTIIHEDLAKQAGAKVRCSGMNTSMVNWSGITVVGEADVHISYDKYMHEP